jgi:hypothetical protein
MEVSMKRLFALILFSSLAFAQAATEKPKEEAKKSCCGESCCAEMKDKKADKTAKDAKKEGCCASEGKEGSMCARKPLKDDKKGD